MASVSWRYGAWGKEEVIVAYHAVAASHPDAAALQFAGRRDEWWQRRAWRARRAAVVEARKDDWQRRSWTRSSPSRPLWIQQQHDPGSC